MKISELTWDSQLFGYAVGKLELEQPNFDHSGFLEQAKNFKLVYIISSHPIPNLPENTTLVDTKVTLLKVLNGTETANKVDFFEGELSQNLISLGFQSGEFSRFKVDRRLTRGEFEKLYIKWLERDLKSGKIIVQNHENQCIGMITLSYKENRSAIGLFAVDDAFRGKGIGYQLLKSAESVSAQLGLNEITVQTQDQNLRALRIYKEFGFEILDKKFIYHYFNPKDITPNS